MGRAVSELAEAWRQGDSGPAVRRASWEGRYVLVPQAARSGGRRRSAWHPHRMSSEVHGRHEGTGEPWELHSAGGRRDFPSGPE